MIIVLQSPACSLPLLPVIGEIREFVRYAGEHQQLLVGIIGVLFLISVLCSKEQNRLLLIFYSAVVVYLTLLNRKAGNRRFLLTPLWSYRRFFEHVYFRRQIINNILLFVPFGFILSRLIPKWSTVRILIMISVGIELLQYLSGRGFFELDDIISNSLGGLIGLTVGMLWMYAVRFLRRPKN